MFEIYTECFKIELVEVIKVNGRKKRFAERSETLSVPLVCPWSEPSYGSFALTINAWMIIYIMSLQISGIVYASSTFV